MTEFDVMAEAEELLESGAGYHQVIQQFGIHACRFELAEEFGNLLASYDQDSARAAWSRHLERLVDGGYLVVSERAA